MSVVEEAGLLKARATDFSIAAIMGAAAKMTPAAREGEYTRLGFLYLVALFWGVSGLCRVSERLFPYLKSHVTIYTCLVLPAPCSVASAEIKSVCLDVACVVMFLDVVRLYHHLSLCPVWCYSSGLRVCV